jgi:hypothetical protein
MHELSDRCFTVEVENACPSQSSTKLRLDNKAVVGKE